VVYNLAPSCRSSVWIATRSRPLAPRWGSLSAMDVARSALARASSPSSRTTVRGVRAPAAAPPVGGREPWSGENPRHTSRTPIVPENRKASISTPEYVGTQWEFPGAGARETGTILSLSRLGQRVLIPPVGVQWELPGACGAERPESRPRLPSQSQAVDGHSGRTGAFHV